VDRAQIRIGERLTYRISVRRPESVTIQWPEIGGELAGFEVEDARTSRPLRQGSLILEERTYRLRTFEAGDHEIPEAVVGVLTAVGVRGQARAAGPITVDVQSVLPKDLASADIRDVKPPVPAGLWRWWVLGAALLAAAGIALVWWMRRRPARPAVGPGPRPAHEIALEALERLRQEWLPGKGRYEEYYVRLSGIARTYVEGRFGLRAPEMTTEEFLQSVVQAPELTAEQRELLRDFLTHCDLVKFARYQPSAEEAGQAFASAHRFVVQTKIIQVTNDQVPSSK
jgi:hypothetical protein